MEKFKVLSVRECSNGSFLITIAKPVDTPLGQMSSGYRAFTSKKHEVGAELELDINSFEVDNVSIKRTLEDGSEVTNTVKYLRPA